MVQRAVRGIERIVFFGREIVENFRTKDLVMSSDETSIRVEPVFFKSADVPQENNNWLNTWEICDACSSVVKKINEEKKKECVEGAQRIGGAWRIYLTDETARVMLLSEGITLRGQQVELKEQNPFRIAPEFDMYETTRLFIRNVPLSFDNAEIEKTLRNKGVVMVNPMKYSRARDPKGKLTNFKTGDRFVDIVVPDDALPKQMSVGAFTAFLYYKEQKQAEKELECGNCMEKGHRRKECPNTVVCYNCRQPGHKKGDPECPSVPDHLEGDDAVSDARSDTSANASFDTETGHVSDDDSANKEEERSVSQMLEGALTSQATPTGKHIQSLITRYVPGSKSGSAASRSSSPASRRKMADRSPDIDQDSIKQKDKMAKKLKDKK